MNVPELLNKKFLEWQFHSGKRKSIEEFGNLFGASKSLVSAWMNGKRQPGPEFKQRIIAIYGDEALEAFGEDPDLYVITENWDNFPPELRRAMREQAQQYTTKNDTKQPHKKARARTSN